MAFIIDLDKRKRRKWRECFGKHNRPGTRTATAMRGGKGFVQVDMHRIDAQIPRTYTSYDRIEVRAIAIDQSARFMHGTRG